MASQDTLHYAESEEESARVLQHEIEGKQAAVESLQRDINEKMQLVEDLQRKQRVHTDAAGRLRQQAAQEQKNEQDELARQQANDKDSLLKRSAKEAAKHGFFG